MSIVECRGGIDGTLVGVQNDGICLFLCFFYEIFQTSVVGPAVSRDRRQMAGEYFVVVCIQQVCPFISDPFVPDPILCSAAFRKVRTFEFPPEPAAEQVMDRTIFWITFPLSVVPAPEKTITPTRLCAAVVPWYAPWQAPLEVPLFQAVDP